MAISVFPAAAATGGGGVNAFAATITSVGTVYENANNFDTGVYTISVNPTSTNARLTFSTGSTIITTVDTTSGTVGLNLQTAATRVFISTATGGTPGAIVTISKTANALVPDDIGNGTLDTINATGQYNQTGFLGVLVVGGGAGGNRGYAGGNGYGQGGSGGRAGFINGGMVQTNTATTVTVGAKGIGETRSAAGVAPNNSSFGNLITANAASNLFANGNGGNAGPSNGLGTGGAGGTSGTFSSWNGNSTTGGGGGGGGQYYAVANGGGSGIGTGGSSAPNGAKGGNGTGKGSGGGGGRGRRNTEDIVNDAGDGADGVVYVMRGF